MVDKVTKRLRLDLKNVKNKSKAKEEVGNYLLKKIDSYLNKAKSPVTGGKFKSLKKDYAKTKGKLGGRKVPDLFLEGDMRSQISFTPFRDGIDIGVFDQDEAQKADNHNKNSAKSKKTSVPLRQFIPYDKVKGTRGSFHKEIKDGIDAILEKHADKS